MKKILLYLPLCVLIAGVILQCSSLFNNNENTYLRQENSSEQYFSKINEIIKDLDFFSAEVKDGKIVLYDRSYEPTSEIPFADYDESKWFIGAYKSNNVVRFITSGAVDDEWGIMFVNDDSNSMMDGLLRADRVGGCAFKYTARRED